MKTEIRSLHNFDLESVDIIDAPYTVIGNSVLLPSFMVSLSVKGLKEILSIAKESDTLRITIHDKKITEFSIIRKRQEKPCVSS